MSRYTILKTKDGSQTIEDSVFGATFHSLHGAVSESNHIFIIAGLQYLLDINKPHSVHILEMGLGSGLNAALSVLKSQAYPQVKFTYTSVEAYPVENSVINAFSATFQAIDKDLAQKITSVHLADWDIDTQLESNFILKKVHKQWTDYVHNEKADLLFYDAFAPSVQPEMWNEEAALKMASMLKTGGVVCTYCVQGSFRRAMERAGFTIEKLSGPPGKREMLRAVLG